MAYVNAFQVNPKTLNRCLIIQLKVVCIPPAAVVVTGTRKLKSMLLQARAKALNTGHLEHPTDNKTFADDEPSSRTNQLLESFPEKENRRGGYVEGRRSLQNDDGDVCNCCGGRRCGRNSSGDRTSEEADGEVHVM